MPFLHANEIDLYYEVHGEGPALVLGHGAGGNHLVWWQQVPHFAQHHRVITYDHRGFGLSHDVPGGPGRRAFPLDLHALLDHLAVDQFAMVAHSMAGRTVTPFIRLFPNRVRALVLSGTLGGAVNDDVRAIQAAHAKTVAGQTLRQRSLAPATEIARADLAYLYRSLNRLNPKRSKQFLAPQPGLLSWRGSSMPLLQTAGIPLLFMVGEHDMIVPPAALRAAHEAMPDSTFVEIADAGHSVYFEQPEAFNRAVDAFLREAWPNASVTSNADGAQAAS